MHGVERVDAKSYKAAVAAQARNGFLTKAVCSAVGIILDPIGWRENEHEKFFSSYLDCYLEKI